MKVEGEVEQGFFFFESCGENTGRHSGISHFTREREGEREFFSCHREEKIDFPRDKLEFWSFGRKLGLVSLLVLDERSTDDGSYFSCYIFMTWNGEICAREGKFLLEYILCSSLDASGGIFRIPNFFKQIFVLHFYPSLTS